MLASIPYFFNFFFKYYATLSVECLKEFHPTLIQVQWVLQIVMHSSLECSRKKSYISLGWWFLIFFSFNAYFRELAVELPFTLTHPKPPDSPPPSRSASIAPQEGGDAPIDTNLIQLDTKWVPVDTSWHCLVYLFIVYFTLGWLILMRSCCIWHSSTFLNYLSI